MLRVMLLRHGQAGSADDDFERPLTRHGAEHIGRVAAALQELGWWPEAVLASSARRTAETARLLGASFNERDALYEATIHTLRAQLLTMRGTSRMLVGHNPGLSEVATWLSGTLVGLSPGAVALLRHDGDDWHEAFDEGRRFVLEGVCQVR